MFYCRNGNGNDDTRKRMKVTNLGYTQTERQRHPMLVYGDSWEWVSGPIFKYHHRPALDDADARCRYSLKDF